MKSSKKILVGFGEALAAPEVCFSLYNDGWQISAFTRNRKTCSLRFLPFIELHEVPAPEINTDATINELSGLIAQLNPNGFMPLDDFSLWLCSRMERENRLGESCKAICAASDAVGVALDKSLQVEAAIKTGLSVPETMIASTTSQISTWDHFPCIAKPALAATEHTNEDGISSRLDKGDAATFNHKNELTAWIEKNSDGTPFLIQPLIKGVGEGIFGVMTQNGVKAWSAHERVRMMNPHGSGSSACKNRQVEAALKGKVENFLHQIGWSGFFMVEMLKDADGTCWFMELNGRSWGSMALARRAGLDYPAWMVQSKLHTIDIPEKIDLHQPLTVRHIGREILHMLFVLKGPKTDFYKADWPGRIKTLFKIMHPHTLHNFYNFHPKFPTFFLKDGFQTVRNFFAK